ncbi:MAG: peptidylprolyl isomerase [Calditrichaeota bacterium]|nr:peptidylprolyl isomerase [Calditrichota bacterium]
MKQLLYFCILFFSLNAQELVDEILAVVGNEMITRSDLIQTLQFLKYQNKLSDQQIAEQRPYVMKQLVDNKLLYMKSKLDSIEVDQQRLDEVAAERWREFVRRAGGESAIEDIYGEPVKFIKKRQKKALEEEFAINELRQRFMGQVNISRSEEEQFFKQHRDSLPPQPERLEIARILMRVEPNKKLLNEAYQKAEKALERLKNGEDFAELAKEISEGPSAKNGGYLGMARKEGDYFPEFAKAADQLQRPNDISEKPVLSQAGYHIIKLHSKTDTEFELSHILFLVQPTEADAQVTIDYLDSIRQEIIRGNLDFDEAANKYNVNEVERDKFGYLGIAEYDRIPDEDLKTKLALMIDGEVSRAYQSSEGVQIVKLIKRYDQSEYDLKKDYSSVEQLALNYKRQTEFAKLLDNLKNQIPMDLY